MQTVSEPCPIYAWCEGHERDDHLADQSQHYGPLVTAAAGASILDVTAVIDESGTQFNFEVPIWTIDSEAVDSEIADLHAIVDQIESAMKKFVLTGEVTR